MEVLVVSKSFIIREAMEIFFENNFDNCIVKKNKELKEIMDIDLSLTEIVFVEAENDVVEHLVKIKKYYKHLKIIVLNNKNDKSILLNCFKSKIEGCILDIHDKEDLIYIINTIRKGKKHYDLDMLYDIVEDQLYDNNIELLTNREKEVLDMVGLGFTNKDIAKNLYLSENTIKKHITNILCKLDMRNRKDLIIYIKENNIKMKNVI
ncbi:response regulator transcription factor [Terrisporobacter sp.]